MFKHLQRYFSSILNNLLPKKIKRVLFIGSAAGFIEQFRGSDDDLCRQLNDLLNLAHDKDSIQLPRFLGKLIWRQLGQTKTHLTNSVEIAYDEIQDKDVPFIDHEALKYHFNKLKPGWLIYGSDDLIRHDIDAVCELMLYVKSNHHAIS